MAKSIADKIDVGMIMLNVDADDLQKLEPILATGVFDTPNMKMSIYKNRRGKYKGVYLWCKANLACCRIKPMFCTTYGYDMIEMDDLRIMVQEESAFECDDE